MSNFLIIIGLLFALHPVSGLHTSSANLNQNSGPKIKVFSSTGEEIGESAISPKDASILRVLIVDEEVEGVTYIVKSLRVMVQGSSPKIVNGSVVNLGSVKDGSIKIVVDNVVRRDSDGGQRQVNLPSNSFNINVSSSAKNTIPMNWPKFSVRTLAGTLSDDQPVSVEDASSIYLNIRDFKPAENSEDNVVYIIRSVRVVRPGFAVKEFRGSTIKLEDIKPGVINISVTEVVKSMYNGTIEPTDYKYTAKIIVK